MTNNPKCPKELQNFDFIETLQEWAKDDSGRWWRLNNGSFPGTVVCHLEWIEGEIKCGACGAGATAEFAVDSAFEQIELHIHTQKRMKALEELSKLDQEMGLQ